jgi:hypothetical protein
MIINIKVSIKKLLKEKYNIAPEVTEEMFNSGILKEHICKVILIKDEYKQKVKPEESERLRYKLAEKYCVSERFIRKVLYETAFTGI